jgi:sugar porter (SP) family MFS transporter
MDKNPNSKIDGREAQHQEYPDLEKYASSQSSSDSFIHKAAQVGDITHNPLRDISREAVIRNARAFAIKHELAEDQEYFVRGAVLAQSGDTDHLTDDEKIVVDEETKHRWRQPLTLYYLTIMCAMCAVVQGMDETVINGAQLYFFPRFGLEGQSNSTWLQGLVVGAPYLCCCVIGCALTEPLNNLIGRRGVIFLSCFIAAVASIWEAFTYSWVQLFLARLLLGLGIGPKSTTVPVYAAECTPAPIRGALVMMWQTWTAFGIMLGYILCVAFQPNGTTISKDLGWRLMLGSTVVAPILVCLQVYFVPESPRWYIKKNRYRDAYNSLLRLRKSKLQAARDLYYMATLIAINNEINEGRNLLLDIIKVGRNRRAFYASQVVMFMQQFCGVNVIAYYSSTIFTEAGFSESSALLASMGFGILNFLFALPAVFTIDTFGRRSLALFTTPFLALFLLFTGMSFYIPENSKAHIGCIALGIYLYTIFYSPGMGPVPFTYSAEVFPLHIRDVGMSLATMTLWGFNFILSLTWTSLLKRLGAPGAFGYYAGWNVVGFLLIFFLVPETKALTLEELDITFSVPVQKFVSYQIGNIPWNIRRHILFQKNLPPKKQLYEIERDD